MAALTLVAVLLGKETKHTSLDDDEIPAADPDENPDTVASSVA
ncbi:hypothetical protein AB0K02_24580 [Streptomyces sp. NPDC049597]